MKPVFTRKQKQFLSVKKREIARRISAQMKRRGANIAALAKATGLNQGNISAMLGRDDASVMQLEGLYRIAMALNVSIRKIIPEY